MRIKNQDVINLYLLLKEKNLKMMKKKKCKSFLNN